MNELTAAALTAFFGVLVFVLGQIIIRAIVDPVLKQRRTIGEIAYSYTFLGNVSGYATPDEIIEARKTLRRLGSELRASRKEISFYKILQALRLVLPEDKLEKAASNLIGWSKSVAETSDRGTHRTELGKALNLGG